MNGELGALEVLVGVTLVTAAVVALWAPRLSAMVAFLSFGVVLTSLWAVMGAPDIALAEAALGTGVTGALFIEAVTRDERTRTRGYPLWWAAIAAGALGIAMIPMVARLAIRAEGGQATREAIDSLALSGVEHPVTAVLLSYRAYDTLLEIAVLLVAVVVARSLNHAAAPPPRSPALMNAFAARLLPLLVIVAGWVLFAGSTLPGGAFQAGAVFAGALVLARVTGLGRSVWRITTGAAALGLLSFLGFAAIGLSEGTWLALPAPAAAALIVTLEAVLTVSIGVSLAILVAAVSDADRTTAEVAP